jgi:hypothetical protein
VKIFLLIISVQIFSAFAWAAPAYRCDVEYVERGTTNTIRTEFVAIDYSGFADTCESNCYKQDYIVGGKLGDPEIVALISHKEGTNGISTMLIYLSLDQDGIYIQRSLAGTDFGNRIYTQVSIQEPNVDLYINCISNP